MKNFQVGVFIWIIGCLKLTVVLLAIWGFCKIAIIIKEAASESPFIIVMIAAGVFALLALVKKIKG